MTPARDALFVQLRKGVLEYCVLARLRRGPAYGLELATELSRKASLFSREGTLYPLLARLRRQGWVETMWQPSFSGPPRRYYTLTEEGGQALAAFEQGWSEFTGDVQAVLREDRS